MTESAANPHGRPRIAVWRWVVWWLLLVLADFAFYVVLTPLWLGGRGLAWLAEWRARRRPPDVSAS